MKFVLATFAMLFFFTSASHAADFTVTTNSSATNGGNTLADGDTLAIAESGNISTLFAPAVDGVASNVFISNLGSLLALGGADGISFMGNNIVAVNGNIINAAGDGVYIFGDNAAVSNTGTISSGLNGIIIDGIGANIANSGDVFADLGGMVALGANSNISNSSNVVSWNLDGLVIVGGSSSVTNTGRVEAFVDGVYVDGSDNTIFNSGTIVAFEDGIDSEGASGDTITNTGSILAARDGIETDGDDVTVNNSGRVVAGSDAFDLNGANSVLNLFYGSNIEGLLSFDGVTGILNYGPGINAALMNDGGDPAIVTAPNGATFTVGNIHYAINSDQFRVNRDRFNNLLPQFQNIAWQAHGRGLVDNAAFGFGSQLSDEPGIWVRLGGSFADRGATSASAGYETTAGYLIAGIAVADDFGTYIAYDHSSSELENSFDTTNQSFIGSLYGTADQGGYAADWSVTGAYVSGDHQRTVLNNTIVGGIETSQGDNESFVVSPAVGFRSHLAANQQANLDFRYVGIFANGYTESGITSPMSFTDQDSHSFIAMPSVDWFVGDDDKPVQVTLGTELRYYWGDDLTASFSTGSAKFSPSDTNFEARGFARVWFEHELDNGWLVSSNGEVGLSTVGEVDISATFGLKKVL